MKYTYLKTFVMKHAINYHHLLKKSEQKLFYFYYILLPCSLHCKINKTKNKNIVALSCDEASEQGAKIPSAGYADWRI